MDNQQKQNRRLRRFAAMTLVLIALSIGTTTPGWAKEYQPDQADLEVRAAIQHLIRGAGVVYVNKEVGWQVIAFRSQDRERLREVAPTVEYIANQGFAVLHKTSPAWTDSKGRVVHTLTLKAGSRASTFYRAVSRQSVVLAAEVQKVRAQVTAHHKDLADLRADVNERRAKEGKPPLKAHPVTPEPDRDLRAAPPPGPVETPGKPVVLKTTPPPTPAPAKKAPQPSKPAVKKKPVAKPPAKKTTTTKVVEPKVTISVTSGPTSEGGTVVLAGKATNATEVRVIIGSYPKKADLGKDGQWAIRFTDVRPKTYRLRARAYSVSGKQTAIWTGEVTVAAPLKPSPEPSANAGGGTAPTPGPSPTAEQPPQPPPINSGAQLLIPSQVSAKADTIVSGVAGNQTARRIRLVVGKTTIEEFQLEAGDLGWKRKISFDLKPGPYTVRAVEIDASGTELPGGATTAIKIVKGGG